MLIYINIVRSSSHSALKFIFRSNHDCPINVLESVANECFPLHRSDRYIIEDIILQMASNVHGKLNDIRFVALIERIHDVISTQECFAMKYPFNIALNVLLQEQTIAHASNGKYMEAAEGQKHRDALFDFEVSRRHKGLHSKQTQNILNLEKAHHDQYEQFIQQWHNFQESFEDRAERAIISMKEHHSKALQHIEKKLLIKARKKPCLHSKGRIKELRKKETKLAQEEHYGEAQKFKEISDAMEEEERLNNIAFNENSLTHKAADFRKHQEAEIMALSKRIDSQMKANNKKKEADCKRLIQQHHNIQMVLKSKYTIDGQSQFTNIEKDVRIKIDHWKEEKMTKNQI